MKRFDNHISCETSRWVLASIGLLLVFATVLVSSSSMASSRVADVADSFKFVDIDRYVVEQRPLKKGTGTLLKPRPIGFDASVKQHPHEREVTYMYQVLNFFPMNPRPVVNHRMFVTTPGGYIMPVYVEDQAVKTIRDGLKEDGKTVRFIGYHMYNYSKGPAILVTGFR